MPVRDEDNNTLVTGFIYLNITRKPVPTELLPLFSPATAILIVEKNTSSSIPCIFIFSCLEVPVPTASRNAAPAPARTAQFSNSPPNFCPLDHRTSASGTSMRCSLGSVTVNERVSPGCIGTSPERRQPDTDRFHTVPCLWNGPVLYVMKHCTGKRRKGRIEKGIGASQGGVL